MNGTPRLGSMYPPDSFRASPNSNGTPSSIPTREGSSPSRTVPLAPRSMSSPSRETTEAPLIPLTLIDAPSQRFYVFALYIALLGWRLYDWAKLVEDEADSLWLFSKWVAIDAVVFLYSFPALRIPWLEWSNPVIMGVFGVHAVVNGILMFRIPIPLEAFLAVLVKTLYDRELSILENRVKPASILHNSSLIMGKHIINVLPEGSAILNLDRRSFCVDNLHSSAELPMQFNSSTPSHIELLRFDFDTGKKETIEIKGKEVTTMIKHASKRNPDDQTNSLILEYAVRMPGLYRLQKVVDISGLEVQRESPDTLVVTCPKAIIKPSTSTRCQGDLSDVTIEVKGVPPMKIVYRRTINKDDQSFHFQSIQPENFISPLLGSFPASSLESGLEEDLSWARSHSIDVRLNESMVTVGKWVYAIDEVHDAVGNIANFSADVEEGERLTAKRSHLERTFTVRERPVAWLKGCDAHNPLKFAKHTRSQLPVEFEVTDTNLGDLFNTITWKFSPLDELTASGDHGRNATTEEFTVQWNTHRPVADQTGLYTLMSVEDSYCGGEIKEPASCLLLHPPEPDLSITTEKIYDKCAGNAIGLLVDLDLTGTPPFIVHIEIVHNKQMTNRQLRVIGSRHQLEIKPPDAGHFKYRFTSIDDQVYGDHPLNSQALTLEQDVKPPASAYITRYSDEKEPCVGEVMRANVSLQGERPFTLEYELIENGKRKRQKISEIDEDTVEISIEPSKHGREYALKLTSVQDKTGCKIFLDDEKTFLVRQGPKASFGLIDGKRTMRTLEGERIELPLRLEGVPPWIISYRNVDDLNDEIHPVLKTDTNDILEVNQRGTYELVDVIDTDCPGSVDQSVSFHVEWIPRPDIKLADNTGLVPDGEKLLKQPVCQGDMDAVQINLLGSPPYHLEYKQRYKPMTGSASISKKELDVGLGVANIPMDTSKAGLHTYEFFGLSDNFYNNDLQSKPLILQQTVYSNPSASFAKPGHSYSYCNSKEAGGEVIIIILQGAPPFTIEIEIKHQSSSKPVTLNLPNIFTDHYELSIPREKLSLGAHHISVRKIRDSRGCERKIEYGAPHVQVHVFDVPKVYPLETRMDYCVGDRISYTLSGTPPFEIYYTFDDAKRKAKSSSTNFKRIAEKSGEFVITAVSDKTSECKAYVEIAKTVHEMPSVKVSKGKRQEVDIHEGGSANILFEFWGTPPFEFTYTRSTNAKKGQKSHVLETRSEISHSYSKTIRSSQEGTYEVVAIKDKYCAFSTKEVEAKGAQKLLQL